MSDIDGRMSSRGTIGVGSPVPPPHPTNRSRPHTQSQSQPQTQNEKRTGNNNTISQSLANDADDTDDTPMPTTQAKSSPLDFVEWGPPPDMNQRELIFDSLNKIVTSQPQKGSGYTGKSGSSANGGKGDSRGTYVFTWGAGYHGQLGRKFVRGQKKYSAIPMMVEMGHVIRQVTCGGLHTAVVTEEGKVFTWGDGRRGELGHIHDPSLKQTPRMVEMLDHVFVTSVACGGSHTVAITDSGQLYSWGWSRYGQTGHGERANVKFPKRIDHPLVKDIVQVACGSKHTMAITRSGTVIAFGANRHGQCGLSDFEDRLEPNRIESLRDTPISYVSCGAIHSCLVTTTGDVYICGFGEYFIPDESQHFFPEPRRVQLPEPIRSISCGQAHNLALSVNNNVYAFGSGEFGSLGYGVKANSATPRLVLDTKNIRQVAAGRYHSFALTDSGILYSWGCGENGQLGLNSDENVLLPTVVTPILGTVVGQVACGEHHTAILTSAPWTKLSADVHEWLHAAKVEHELKELYLKKTHRGLTQKDLAKLAIEKEKWRIANEARKKELEQEEKQYIDAEVESVQFEKELQSEVAKALARAEKDPNRADKSTNDNFNSTGSLTSTHGNMSKGKSSVSNLHLPPVHDSHHRDETGHDDEEKQSGSQTARASSSSVTRLPTLGKKKSTGSFPSGSQTERATIGSAGGAQAQVQVAPLQFDSAAATVRLDRSYDQTQRADSSYGGSVMPPSARTQFLKETAQMIRRMTHVIHDKGEAQSQRELNEALQQVFAFRKEYDSLRNTSRALAKKATDLKREADLLESGSSSSADSKEDTDVRLQNLQMQLNTVTIKIAETSENRRNYELNIAHLKEEEFDHFNQLKALRKQNSDTHLYLKKMEDLRGQSVLERQKSENELNAFRAEIAAYEKFVQSQKAQFHNILEIVRTQNEKREKAKQAREEKATASVALRVSQLNTEQMNAEKESGSLSNKLLSLELKLRHFEDSFSKISSATGLNHPDAIINRFFFKGEIREQLQSEIDEKQHQLELLRREEDELRSTLEEAKLNFKDQTWRDVESLSENTREVSTRSNKAQKEIERVTQRLAFVQEGLLYLIKHIESHALQGQQLPPSANDPQLAALEIGSENESSEDGNAVKGLWNPSQSSAVFAKLDSTLNLLFSSLARAEEQHRLLEMSSQQRSHQGGTVNKPNDQQKLLGFNMKHLRMLSEQNQMIDQHMQEQQHEHANGSRSEDGDDDAQSETNSNVETDGAFYADDANAMN